MTVTEVVNLTPADFVERSNKGEDWRLLDVREPWELNIASVAETMAIPMASIPGRVGELNRLDRVAVLCHSGVRSARVAAWLLQQGLPQPD